MKVVIDTNVFVSSFFGGNPRKIVDMWRNGKVTLCLSKDIVDEYVKVLQRLGLENEAELKELLEFLAKGYNLIFTTKTPKIRAIKEDPDDDKFIECAVALKADVVITGDRALKKIKEYLGIRIFTPEQFLKN